ncbi:MAG: hypothetical protein ACYCQK_01070 [Acidiferrobacteraceae bacterium]
MGRISAWLQRRERGHPEPAPNDTLVLQDAATIVPPEFLAALEGLFAPVRILKLSGGEGVRRTEREVAQRVRHTAPKRIVILGALPCDEGFLRETRAPILWISPRGDEALAALARLVTLRSARHQRRLPDAHVTGDPLLDVDAPPDAPDPSLCRRFQPLRSRGRWILYFAGTEAGEEAKAYGAFLQVSRAGAGLLALAPRDPARFEPVYRDAMRFHLATIRHGRLMTASVPQHTRVYYLEDPVARRAMHVCADVVVVGGTLMTPGPAEDAVLPLSLGRPVIVGPLARGPLLGAARTDGAVCAVDDLSMLDSVLAPLLARSEEARLQGDAGKTWIGLQAGAAQRVLTLLARHVSD